MQLKKNPPNETFCHQITIIICKTSKRTELPPKISNIRQIPY